MAKNLNYAALLLVLAFTACQKEIQRDAANEPLAQKAPSGGTTESTRTINLEVQVIDMQSGISSDGKGLYINGQDKVGAVIWGDSGDFFMNTNNNTAREAIRKIAFNGEYPNNLNNVRNYRMRTQNGDGDPATLLHKMNVNDTIHVGFFIWGEQPLGIFEWKLRFQYYQDPVYATEVYTTDYVLVTKTSTAPNTWVLESLNLHKGYLQDVKNYPGGISGYHSVPFKFILKERAK